jgi:predicted O-methyltransferase YrrM
LELIPLAQKHLSEAEVVLSEIEVLSQKSFLPIIGPEKGTVLVDAICHHKPKRLLEVGTLIGYSAIMMGKELPADAELITIEIHGDEAYVAERNIQRARIAAKIQVLVGDAKKVIPKLSGKFDLVFLDAEKIEYIEYLRLVEDKLNPEAVVIADNAGIFAEQMHEYLEYVRSSGKYRSRYFGFGSDGVEVSVKL